MGGSGTCSSSGHGRGDISASVSGGELPLDIDALVVGGEPTEVFAACLLVPPLQLTRAITVNRPIALRLINMHPPRPCSDTWPQGLRGELGSGPANPSTRGVQ